MYVSSPSIATAGTMFLEYWSAKYGRSAEVQDLGFVVNLRRRMVFECFSLCRRHHPTRLHLRQTGRTLGTRDGSEPGVILEAPFYLRRKGLENGLGAE